MAERNGADLLARYAASIAASFKAPAHMARIVFIPNSPAQRA